MLKALENSDRAKVAVVGDIMLDIYIQGGVERISPEAPVPVIQQISERIVPGGAANVAANIAALGASVRLVGLAGQDNDFGKLSAELDKIGSVDLSGVLATSARSTTTKTRILGHRQQIARLDREDAAAISDEIEQGLIARAIKAIDDCDLLVLSDYGKGVLSDPVLRTALDHARVTGKIAIVDPKRRDLAAYRGASLITPNRAELVLATGERCDGDEEVVNAARKVHLASGADLLVTRSEKGMSFVPKQGEPIHLTTAARQVFDVSGAGDTVVATLAVMLAIGAPMIDAMKAANHAAGIVVGKLGTATVSRHELFSALNASEADDVQDGRLISRTELLALRSRWQDEGLVVGFANGCFDVLHPGHVSLIRQAANACDRLVVALNTDQSVRRLKGPTRPVQSEQARADVMGSIKGVSVVVLFDEETPLELIQAMQPDLLIKGADYTEAEVVGGDIVKARGGRILLARLTEGQSTTSLISKWQGKTVQDKATQDKTSSVGA
jgi:D-beta-D-heptose 7-phosphate kinase/D-beta-D-heptose 1-phosphate adenosyltransferase